MPHTEYAEVHLDFTATTIIGLIKFLIVWK